MNRVNTHAGTVLAESLVDPRTAALVPVNEDTLKYKTVRIACRPHFEQVLAFARERAVQHRLFDGLDYLAGWISERYHTRVDLGYDFAPQSFWYTIWDDGPRDGPKYPEPRVALAGVLMYEGPGNQPHGGAPCYSVTLGSEKAEGWYARS
jgi:hypothetical protein